ncbi:MAG: tetraacyldisaccharide 4'-kinase [Flavobacteriales bacterium]
MLLKKLRLILFPISVLYGFIMYLRNILYDKSIFKSTYFNLPIICVGNLSLGGTGKTPHTEYLASLLKQHYKIAILSRGYGRKTKGYILANKKSTFETLGDEPLQFYSKFGKELTVSVDENRVRGVQNLIKDVNPDVILLDDAFQHRSIKAGLYILLTPFEDLFMDDYVLPAGNLREFRKGANRADIIIVTKCPKEIPIVDKKHIIKRLEKAYRARIYFSSIRYHTKLYGLNELILESVYGQKVLLVTGIANPKPMIDYLRDKVQIVEHLAFSDHHNFSKKDISLIKKKAANKLIITTEKDYMRLKKINLSNQNIYYLPIKIEMDKSKVFYKEITHFINQFNLPQ